MNSTIITIGDEILIGQIVDTNSTYIASALSGIGVRVSETISISDSQAAIEQTLQRAMSSSDLVVITGGLGPTKDDITKHTLAQIFNSPLINNREVEQHVERLLAARGVEFNSLNRGQALVVECCTVLHNTHGTAPGMWFERDGRVVVSLPGVPFEMKSLIDSEVIPRVKARFELRAAIHRTIITSGLAESILAERIEAWESALPEDVKLAYLPSANRVRLRLSAYEVDGVAMGAAIDSAFAELEQIIPEYILGWEGVSEELLIHNELIKRGESVAVAESCTGGVIASRFTALAGASAYFMAGVVSYSNASKVEVLGVRESTLESDGAVSEECAKQMAEGVKRITGSHYAISTTGIAGPSGGSDDKPVGTVWIGVSTPNKTFAVMRNCGTERSQIIERATSYALSLLRAAIGG